MEGEVDYAEAEDRAVRQLEKDFIAADPPEECIMCCSLRRIFIEFPKSSGEKLCLQCASAVAILKTAFTTRELMIYY